MAIVRPSLRWPVAQNVHSWARDSIGACAQPDRTPPMAISEELRSECADIWERQHRHPFVTGIGDGTLDVNRFRFWVRQDYLFLIEYGRVLAFAAARAPDLASMSRFAELTHSTLTTEMDLHRSFCGGLGISRADLEAEPMARTTQGYTDFLVRVAAQADFALVLAALLPCMWGFSEIGQRLAERGRPADPRYAAWIEMYASDEFAALAAWCREIVDGVGADAGARTREAMGRTFRTSSEYELAFWQMAFDECP
jgi:thiaminase/transcriptional activator TenA